MNIEKLIRPNIRKLTPYSSARNEYSANTQKSPIYLDANENPYGLNNLNRYPDPLQTGLRNKLAKLKKISADNILIGNGSDELIDLLVRIFCEPGQDSLTYCPPTFEMYRVAANINNIKTLEIPLDHDFDLPVEQILKQGQKSKILFICSPNNPTGNEMSLQRIEKILNNFPGIIVIDEAYKEFSDQPSQLEKIKRFPNLVVLQTFSKYWGSAGIRMGMAYADKRIIELFIKVKKPYNTGILSAQTAIKQLNDYQQFLKIQKTLLQEKIKLVAKFKTIPQITKIYPSNANFILIQINKAEIIYKKLLKKGIIVRNFANKPFTENCLRITIGKPSENDELCRILKSIIV